jgi:hypothetical protein
MMRLFEAPSERAASMNWLSRIDRSEHAGDDADRDGDDGRDERDAERDARAVDRARHHVAADVVDAERVVLAGPGRQPEVVEGALVRMVRVREPEDVDDERREDRHEDEDADDAERDQRDAIALEAAPEEVGGSARLDVVRLRAASREQVRCLLPPDVDGGANPSSPSCSPFLPAPGGRPVCFALDFPSPAQGAALRTAASHTPNGEPDASRGRLLTRPSFAAEP